MVNDSFRANWKAEYLDAFGSEISAGDKKNVDMPEIEADSVLVCYWASGDRQSNSSVVCCYILAQEYAQKELQRKVMDLYKKLTKDDSVAFCAAHDAWQKYYDLEADFVWNAFYAYANIWSYQLGRDVMIERQQHLYRLIKDRIKSVLYYMELANVDE